MTARPSAQKSQGWVVYAGLMMSVAGIIYQGGQLTSDVRRNTERITALEASDKARSDALNAINVRTARIEAKLDYVIPQEGRKP